MINFLGLFTELMGNTFTSLLKDMRKDKNQQDEGIHKVRYGEEGQNFYAFSRSTPLPAPPHVPQPGSSPNPVLLGFNEGFIAQS